MFQILESLKKLNINATFFINGLNVMQNVSLPANALNSTNWTNSTMADLIRRAYNEGHVIGTHTYSHIGLVNGTTGYNLPSELGYVPLNMLQMQLLVNDLVIYDIIKKYPQVFRPPYFEINQTVLHVVESMGYIPIAANVDSVDYAAKSVQDILGNITQGVVRNRNESGIIVLQHDGHNLTAFNLEPVVTYLRNANLSIVDLPTCLNMSSDTLYRSSSLFNKSSNYPTFNQTGLFFNVSSILQVTSTSLVDTTSTDSSTTTPTEITSISTTPTPTTSPITTTSSSTTTQSTKQSQTIRSHVAPRFDLKYGVLQLALILILMFFIL
ncbi:chitin deacetylase [Coelomomyces lativittatus]|nr:chitin deacetylase [Coelomomyces lativittatus]